MNGPYTTTGRGIAPHLSETTGSWIAGRYGGVVHIGLDTTVIRVDGAPPEQPGAGATIHVPPLAHVIIAGPQGEPLGQPREIARFFHNPPPPTTGATCPTTSSPTPPASPASHSANTSNTSPPPAT